jgi:hypothetical protein
LLPKLWGNYTFQFNKEETVTPKEDRFQTGPTQDRIHCVVIVLDATTLDVVSDKVIEKIKKFQRLMNERGKAFMLKDKEGIWVGGE